MKLFDVILFICLIFLTTLYWSEWIIYPLILTLFVVSLIAYSRRMKGNAFHPLAYVIYIFFTLLVIPLFIVPLTVYDQSLLQEIPKVSMLIGLATISVYIGYYMRAGRNIATFIPLVGFPHVRLQRAIIQRIVILYLIGWIGRAALMVVGYSHISSQITKLLSYLSLLKDLSNFSILCFTMLIYYIFTSISKRQMSRSVGYTYIVGLSILEITYGVMYGGRSAIIMPFLMILFSYSFSVKRIRWSVIVTLFLSAMLIAGPIITAYRVSFFDALLDTSNVSRSAVVMAALDKTKMQKINWVEASMEVFQHRTGTVETTMRMMNRVPSKHDYEMGNEAIVDLERESKFLDVIETTTRLSLHMCESLYEKTERLSRHVKHTKRIYEQLNRQQSTAASLFEALDTLGRYTVQIHTILGEGVERLSTTTQNFNLGDFYSGRAEQFSDVNADVFSNESEVNHRLDEEVECILAGEQN